MYIYNYLYVVLYMNIFIEKIGLLNNNSKTKNMQVKLFSFSKSFNNIMWV